MARNTKPDAPAPSADGADDAGGAGIVAAAQRRAAAAAGADRRTANEIAGLLEERRGYVQRDLPDRVRQVDEQLALRGYTGAQ